MPYLPEKRKLLDAFRRGERGALEEVYRYYAPAAAEFLRHGFSFQSRGNPCFFHGFRSAFDLENALQEVFLRAFQESARLRYDGLRPYVNYLFAISRNFVIDEHRRRDAALHLFSPAAATTAAGAAGNEDAPPPFGSPELSAEHGEVERLLAEFLASCEPRQRTYYDLRFAGQLPQEEVAVRMGLTRIQIRRIEAHFRRDLLAHLKRHGYLHAYTGRRLGILSPTALASLGLLALPGAV